MSGSARPRCCCLLARTVCVCCAPVSASGEPISTLPSSCSSRMSCVCSSAMPHSRIFSFLRLPFAVPDPLYDHCRRCAGPAGCRLLQCSALRGRFAVQIRFKCRCLLSGLPLRLAHTLLRAGYHGVQTGCAVLFGLYGQLGGLRTCACSQIARACSSAAAICASSCIAISITSFMTPCGAAFPSQRRIIFSRTIQKKLYILCTECTRFCNFSIAVKKLQ